MSFWRRLFGGGHSEGLKPQRLDYLNEALALERQGDFEGALTSYRLALRDNVNDPRILQNMAIAFTKTGQLEEAIRHYRRALALPRAPMHRRRAAWTAPWGGRWLPSTSGCSGISYFRAIDALVLLAAFRMSAMLEWLPWMAAFLAASVADGAISRVIKSKEFLHHDPERFALYASLAILLTCGGVVAMVVPTSLHTLVAPAGLSVLAMLWGRSIAHFHRRG